MSLSDDLEKIRRDILIRASLEEGPEARERAAKHAKALDGVPVKKFFDQALYIRDNLLPRLEKRGGKDSPDYVFFSDLFYSLLWAITAIDRYDFQGGELQRYKILYRLTRDHQQELEKRLIQYTTMEEFFFSSGLDVVADTIKKRAAELLDKGKKG